MKHSLNRRLRLRPCLVAFALASISAASPLTAQESVFNLSAFGLPASGEGMRARGMGGVTVGLPEDLFSLENPALLARSGRAGFYLSLLGQDSTVENTELSHSSDDVVFPMGQAVFPAWSNTVFSIGYYQLIDFDAALESTVAFEGDTLPVSLDSEGGVFVLAPGLSYGIDEKTGVGASFDVYLGSREIFRSVQRPDLGGVLTTTSDSLSRDFAGLGVTLGVERQFGQGTHIGLAYRLRPTVTSGITTELRGVEVGSETEFNLPNAFSLGASTRLGNQVRVAGVFRRSGWEDFEIDGVSQPDAADFIEYGGGLEYTPDQRNLLIGPRAPIRFGMRWRQLPIVINDQNVNEWALSVGHSRRFGDRSRVDLLFEYGRRGSLDDIGLTERYMRLGFGISAFEQWRRRRS
jgi:hypothetical protein